VVANANELSNDYALKGMKTNQLRNFAELLNHRSEQLSAGYLPKSFNLCIVHLPSSHNGSKEKTESLVTRFAVRDEFNGRMSSSASVA
jgi:hypothetical protein